MDRNAKPTSRRGLLTTGIVGATALALARLPNPESTRAASGDPMILGADNESADSTFLRSTTAGAAALAVSSIGGGTAVQGRSESGAGVFGQSDGVTGFGVLGSNPADGVGLLGVSNGGHAIFGSTSSGVALVGETGFGGGGLALQTLGPVMFGTALLATIPAGKKVVTVAPLSGAIDDERLDLTAETKILCTLVLDPGKRKLHYVSIDTTSNEFDIHLDGPAPGQVTVACFVIN